MEINISFWAAKEPNYCPDANIIGIASGYTFGEVVISFGGWGYQEYIASQNRCPNSVGIENITIEWKYRVPNGSNEWISIGTTGPHKIYRVIDTPDYPMYQPWKEVLEKSCVWASGEPNISGAAGKITDAVFSSGYQYDSDHGAPRYDYNDIFNLTKCLSEWGGTYSINCWDTANMVCIFANALGCDLNRYYITSPVGFYLNYILPIGRGWTNDPFTDIGRDPFALHWTAWNEIYDSCLQVDDDSDPTTSPHTGKQPKNMIFNAGSPAAFDDYRGKLVDPGDVNSVSDSLEYPVGVR